MGVKISGKLLPPLGVELVHGPSGAVTRTIPPVDNGGDGSTFSPTDLCAASLGACATSVIALYAERNGIPLDGVSFEVEKLMHVSPRRLGKLVVTFRIATPAPDEDFQRLVEAGRTCPVRLSLHPDVKLEERYERAAP